MIRLVPFSKSALEQLLEESGLAARRFARLILAARGDRTMRRWQDEGVPEEVEAWARDDVVKLERRGHMLHLQIFAPLDPRMDRKAAGADGD